MKMMLLGSALFVGTLVGGTAAFAQDGRAQCHAEIAMARSAIIQTNAAEEDRDILMETVYDCKLACAAGRYADASGMIKDLMDDLR